MRVSASMRSVLIFVFGVFDNDSHLRLESISDLFDVRGLCASTAAARDEVETAFVRFSEAVSRDLRSDLISHAWVVDELYTQGSGCRRVAVSPLHR